LLSGVKILSASRLTASFPKDKDDIEQKIKSVNKTILYNFSSQHFSYLTTQIK